MRYLVDEVLHCFNFLKISKLSDSYKYVGGYFRSIFRLFLAENPPFFS